MQWKRSSESTASTRQSTPRSDRSRPSPPFISAGLSGQSGKTPCASWGMGAAPLRPFTFTPRTALLYDKEPDILHERTCRRVSDAHCHKDQDSGHTRSGRRALPSLREVPVALQLCSCRAEPELSGEQGSTRYTVSISGMFSRPTLFRN